MGEVRGSDDSVRCAERIAAEVASWPRRPAKVLDISASHGLFGIAIAKAVPQAEIVAIDWENVLSVARRNAEAAGIAKRYRTLAGSAFEVDWGTGYDLILLPNFLHHFDRETCAGLLRKVRLSLAPGGRTLAVEFVPNPDRVSPPLPATFAGLMLATTPRGDAYTAEDFAAIARAAGYKGATVTPLPPSPQSLVAFT
jgi:2-polyprenyl-3-methyl-5-hydroxy-6-metoxy-1,4-benzoquinol methylase